MLCYFAHRPKRGSDGADRLSSPKSSRVSDSFFEANGRRIVFERRKIGDPIEAGLSVECNGFGLSHAGLETHRVIVKFPRQAFQFVQDPPGNPVAPFLWRNKHSLNLNYGLIQRDECPASDGVSVVACDQENASWNRDQFWIE